MIRTLISALARQAMDRWSRPQETLVLGDVGVTAWDYQLVEDGPEWLLSFVHDPRKTGGCFHTGEEVSPLSSTHQLGLGQITSSILTPRWQRVIIQGHGAMYSHSLLGT